MASTQTVSSIVTKYISPLTYSSGTGSATLTVGAVVGVYFRGDSAVFSFGLSSLDGEAPDGTTLFQIGSVTKVFTTSLLGALPFQNSTDAAKFYNSSIAANVPAAYHLSVWEQAITFEQLATFTAGINPSAPSEQSQQAFIEFIDLRSDPGGLPTTNDYSDSSVGFLGQMLISMAGFSDYGTAAAADAWYKANLFDPLSMSSSGHTPPKNAQVATFYSYDYNEANYQPVDQASWVPWGTAGRELSNVNDMLNFVMANLKVTTIGGKSVPTSLTRGMQQAQRQWTTTTNGGGQAFAWTINDYKGNTILTKNGGLPGCAAVVRLCPPLSYGVVALANCGSGVPDVMTGALDAATKQIMAELINLG